MTEIINQLFEGDCLTHMKELPDASIDMVLCDLPYSQTHNKWDIVIPFEPLWEQYLRIVKPNGVLVFTSQGRFTAELICSQIDLFRYKWIWVKSKASNFLNARRQPLRKHEDICVFYRQPPVYHPQMVEGKPYDKGIRKAQASGSYKTFTPCGSKSTSGERFPTDILYFGTAETEGPVIHPTQKPVALGRYLIRTYTNPGDVVLDNAFGSGSFLVAALLEGRNFVGIEKNEGTELFKKEKIDYVKAAEGRLRKAWEGLEEEKREKVYKCNLIKEWGDVSF